MFAFQSSFITMFSSIGLFKRVDCPEHPHCSLSNCIFAHPSVPEVVPVAVSLPEQKSEEVDIDQNGPRKKRRLALPVTASANISPPPRELPIKSNENISASLNKPSTSPKLGVTLPPAKAVQVSLNPKILSNPPAPHAIRIQLITMIHQQMVRLNEEIQDPPQDALRLTPQEMIVEALEEEENIAKQNPMVYMNLIKLRITKLKKMKFPEWKEERLKQIAKRAPFELNAKPENAPKEIETGLSSYQEVAFLSKLVAKQDDLARHGYVPRAPSDEEIAQARLGVEAAQGWEQCDRCKTRFQVFPGGRREEDGALTSGGTCTYHPAKPRRPRAKDKADKGHKEAIYACCNETVGESAGCTLATTHVFKISEPKRLALVMPFEETPPKLLTPGPNVAVCFDCEMGYTTLGLELIRLTATAWPNGEEILDVLVRPLGEVLDLNSRFSGVWPKDYANALSYERGSPNKENLSENSEQRLRLVESPRIARDLLFEHLTPETPLIGHALDNDLNATRIIHPSIVDTVLLFPHPRGLPNRFGLKALMKNHLDRDVQMGGNQGHDSKEDARSAGDLVRLKVGETWKTMKRDGWTVRKTEFFPPPPPLPGAPTNAYPFGTYEGDLEA